MKRVAFDELVNDNLKRINLQIKWIDYVRKYTTTATEELSSIYETLTGISVTGAYHNHNIILAVGDTLLIYAIAGVIRYGPNKLLYPIDDKSLWPWNIGKNPNLSSDVICCIARQLSDFTNVLRMRLVCHSWKHAIDKIPSLVKHYLYIPTKDARQTFKHFWNMNRDDQFTVLQGLCYPQVSVKKYNIDYWQVPYLVQESLRSITDKAVTAVWVIESNVNTPLYIFAFRNVTWLHIWYKHKTFKSKSGISIKTIAKRYKGIMRGVSKSGYIVINFFN